MGETETILSAIQARFESRDELHRASALRMFNSMLLLPEVKPSLGRSLKLLYPLLDDSSSVVRLFLLRIVASLIDSALLLLDDERLFIPFAVRCCSDAELRVRHLARYLLSWTMPSRPQVHVLLWPGSSRRLISAHSILFLCPMMRPLS
jgi:hypothetical protein